MAELISTGDAATRIRQEVKGAHSRERIMAILRQAVIDKRLAGDASERKVLVSYPDALRWYRRFLESRDTGKRIPSKKIGRRAARRLIYGIAADLLFRFEDPALIDALEHQGYKVDDETFDEVLYVKREVIEQLSIRSGEATDTNSAAC